MDKQYLAVLSFVIQLALAVILLVFSFRLLWSDLNRPESEPDPFEVFLDRHAPPWLRRFYKCPLYPDEAAIVAVLVAATTFGLFVWLIDLVFG